MYGLGFEGCWFEGFRFMVLGYSQDLGNPTFCFQNQGLRSWGRWF